MMTDWNLAQLNTSTARYSFDDPRMAPFANGLAAMFDLADQADGFVWRPNAGSNSDQEVRTYGGDQVVINFSVWRDLQSLSVFVYRAQHAAAMKDMGGLFETATEPNQVLWWVAAGHQPTAAEGLARLKLLRRKGPGANAFTFQQPFVSPSEAA